jgi:hypothetical protein
MRIDFSLISSGIEEMMISILEFLMVMRRATFDITLPSRLDESPRSRILWSTVMGPGPGSGFSSNVPKTLILGLGFSGVIFVK